MSVSVSVDNLVLCWASPKCVCLIGKNDRLKWEKLDLKRSTHTQTHDFKKVHNVLKGEDL